jgi:glutamyl-Q tRNA(Asp) synthetase
MKQTGPVSWSRFNIETGRIAAIPVQLDRWGDVVLVRKDIPTTYHLSVVVDDSIQGITHIVRGQDLEAATDIHATLQNLLLLKPPIYIHHPLLRDESGDKLSKSRLSRSLRDERSEGLTLARLKRELGFSESRE